MREDFLIDGMLSGTGVRDAINGGYVEPCSIGISELLASDLSAWQQRYESCHFQDFPAELVIELDAEGISLAARAAVELPNRKVGYYSNGLMKKLV